MQYILTIAEYDSLTPVKRLQARNEALEAARKMIVSDEECGNIHYCTDCPIGQYYTAPKDGEPAYNEQRRKVMDHICIRPKHWPK